MTEQAFAPVDIRYIKLGAGRRWVEAALSEEIIPFGFREADHASCAAGDWEAVRAQLEAGGRTGRRASDDLREIRDFYTLGDDTLWITMAEGLLWWTFASGPVVADESATQDDPSGRYRQTRGGWRSRSLAGETLSLRSLSSALTQTRFYRRTICSVREADYLLRRIRDERSQIDLELVPLQEQMLGVTRRMIEQLDWRDFEVLVDLMFARSGWLRSGQLGGAQPDVDLIVDHPVTGETAWVQVKSSAGQAQFDDYRDRFERDGGADRLFFVCHTETGSMSDPEEPHFHVWTGDRIAEVAIKTGLSDWLASRTR